ncbi:hypothetical protein [Pantoea dispersa]|uniref:hypothetical protein n=1 Tax=Pantoea dispersa TaxID=59814 RepID=UPI001FD3CAD5|nr:hypothetical protein [Pantoea dispersa]
MLLMVAEQNYGRVCRFFPTQHKVIEKWYRLTELKKTTVAGTGQALSQDPSLGFGKGGGTQFFISNYKIVLEPIGSPFGLGV